MISELLLAMMINPDMEKLNLIAKAENVPTIHEVKELQKQSMVQMFVIQHLYYTLYFQSCLN